MEVHKSYMRLISLSTFKRKRQLVNIDSLLLLLVATLWKNMEAYMMDWDWFSMTLQILQTRVTWHIFCQRKYSNIYFDRVSTETTRSFFFFRCVVVSIQNWNLRRRRNRPSCSLQLCRFPIETHEVGSLLTPPSSRRSTADWLLPGDLPAGAQPWRISMDKPAAV